MLKKFPCIASLSVATLVGGPVLAQEGKSPAEGFNIHVLAPHRHEDGTVHGPYHHYCKGIKPEILQCMIFLSTDPNAELVEIEYFIDKKLARSNVTLEQWNKHFHDHKDEVASGRVQVLDVPPEKAKEIAEAASKTDGILFHLWPVGKKIPNGEVMFPTAVSHKPVEKLKVPSNRGNRGGGLASRPALRAYACYLSNHSGENATSARAPIDLSDLSA